VVYSLPQRQGLRKWTNALDGRKGDITVCTGYGNHGKSFFMLQLMLRRSLCGPDFGSGPYFPRTIHVDSYDDLVEMYVGKWLDKMTEQEYTAACNFVDEHLAMFIQKTSTILILHYEKFRYLILKKGVDGVTVDPFSLSAACKRLIKDKTNTFHRY
jgi:hypothetical protein